MDLIISPHIDDEVLGCASFLAPGATVAYMTHKHPLCRESENVAEREAIADWVGFDVVQLHFETNAIAESGYAGVLNEIERLLDEYKPDTVLVPFPSYNQDHRVVHEAALTAMRPHDRIHFVKRVLVYEEPDVPGTMRAATFKPTYFRKLNLKRKLDLYRSYRSQVRSHRGLNHIKAMAIYRGMQCNLRYAEAFEVLRWRE